MAGHAAGEGVFHEDFFEFVSEGVLGVEYGDVSKGEVRGFDGAGVDVPGDEMAFVAKGVEADTSDAGTLFAGVDFAFVEDFIFGNEFPGEAEDFFGGAVVLVQDDGAVQANKVVAEAADVAGVCAAPAVDGLFVVCDNEEASVDEGEHADDFVLFAVCVLEFVYEDVAVAIPTGFQDVVFVAEEVVSDEDEVVEVHEAVVAELGFVGLEQATVSAGEGPVRVAAALAFEAAQVAQDVVEVGFVNVEAVLGTVDEGALEVFACNAEVAGEAGGFVVFAQEAEAEAVEGAGGDEGGSVFAQAVVEAGGHFSGGFVGEGEGEDVFGRDGGFVHEVADAFGEDARFAGAGSGQDQDGAYGRTDGFLLGRVQGEGVGDGVVGVWHKGKGERRFTQRRKDAKGRRFRKRAWVVGADLCVRPVLGWAGVRLEYHNIKRLRPEVQWKGAGVNRDLCGIFVIGGWCLGLDCCLRCLRRPSFLERSKKEGKEDRSLNAARGFHLVWWKAIFCGASALQGRTRGLWRLYPIGSMVFR